MSEQSFRIGGVIVDDVGAGVGERGAQVHIIKRTLKGGTDA
ncbi:hypothetical protein PDG61_06935 [Mycolicibacterium sp. BiH015]|nr:hypothetical protein [Mycolicibacterium sp. BiH015]MDA2890639.1 hypothetical protein [Mycolicibacterium sp. BiH015]